MNVRYDADCEFGAPCVDPKRPYGNSDVYGDIGEILEYKSSAFAEEEPQFTSTDEKEMLALHKSMATVLQILVQHPEGIRIAIYEADKYIQEWELQKAGLS